MRTTVDIHDPLLDRVRRLAAATGRRLSDVVNEALIELLGRRERAPGRARRVDLPVYGGSGFQPGIDPLSNASLEEALDETHRDPDSGAMDIGRLR